MLRQLVSKFYGHQWTMDPYIPVSLLALREISVRLIVLVVSVIGPGWISAAAQTSNNQELARLLSNEQSRKSAVDKILATPDRKLPVLLSWTRHTPPGVSKVDLYVGLADVFGRLKAREAIPFLIENIGLQRWLASPNIWLKTAQVVEERLPAAAALIQIGPEASTAIIHKSWARVAPEDRLAAIFVVSRIGNVPEAGAFLSSVLGEANLERHWAEEGLKALDAGSLPTR